MLFGCDGCHHWCYTVSHGWPQCRPSETDASEVNNSKAEAQTELSIIDTRERQINHVVQYYVAYLATRQSIAHLLFSAADAPGRAGRGLAWFISMLPFQDPDCMDRQTPLEGSSGSTV